MLPSGKVGETEPPPSRPLAGVMETVRLGLWGPVHRAGAGPSGPGPPRPVGRGEWGWGPDPATSRAPAGREPHLQAIAGARPGPQPEEAGRGRPSNAPRPAASSAAPGGAGVDSGALRGGSPSGRRAFGFGRPAAAELETLF